MELYEAFSFNSKHISFCVLNVFIVFLDIDKCVANTHDCAAEADCKNTEGSFTCTCRDGYQGDDKTCQGAEITKWQTLTLFNYDQIKCLISSMFSLEYLSLTGVSQSLSLRRFD